LVTLNVPDITVTGVYEAIGPTSTVAQPFTVLFRATSTGLGPMSLIPGGPGFGNGFSFQPLECVVMYSPVNSAPIFNQVVDHVRFSVQPLPILMNFFVPEPGGVGIFATGIAVIVRGARRRQSALVGCRFASQWRARRI
jgi:hypothetical protein